MEQENQDGLTTLQEITLKPHQERHELDFSSRVMGPDPSPSELEATPSPNHAEAALSPPGRQDSASPKPVAPKPVQGGDERGTRSIPDIVERIRIKKERLWELQELQHLTSIPVCRKTLRAGKSSRYFDFKYLKIYVYLNTSYNVL
jgi:hypothetical protein